MLICGQIKDYHLQDGGGPIRFFFHGPLVVRGLWACDPKYIALNDGMTDERWIGKYLEGTGCGIIEFLSRNLPAGRITKIWVRIARLSAETRIKDPSRILKVESVTIIPNFSVFMPLIMCFLVYFLPCRYSAPPSFLFLSPIFENSWSTRRYRSTYDVKNSNEIYRACYVLTSFQRFHLAS
jgi:hypothetical protein